MAAISLNFMMIFLVILPFIIAIIIFGFRKWLKNFAGEIGAATIIAVVALIAALNYALKSNPSTNIIYGIYDTSKGTDYGPPLGVQLRFDGFTSWFLLIINIVIVFIFIYEATKQREKPEGPIHISLLLFITAGINGVMIANDFFTLFLSWVIIGIAIISLITFRRRAIDLKEGGIRSYISIGLSISFILLAVVLCYGVFGTLNFDVIKNNGSILASTRIQNLTLVLYTIIALVIVGFGLFANIFLLNLWMPKAIEYSPASTQVITTGITSSIALLSIFKVLFSFFNPESFVGMAYPQVLAVIGILTALEGAVLIIYQVTRKDQDKASLTKIIIYSAVVNIGIALTGMSLGGFTIELGSEGIFHLSDIIGYSALQLINLAITMFLTLTAKERLVSKSGSEKLFALRGSAKDYPLTVFMLIIGLSSTIGLLPTFGGVNIYMLVFSLIQLNFIGYAIFIVLILVLMLIGYLMVFKFLIFDKPTTESSFGGNLSQDLSLHTFLGILIALGLILFGLIPSIISNNILENISLMLP
ncbi:MAG: hypothetical protein KGD59_08660 [Candidatus Heimdallarchaeota archaeon]|nr:hypothetical protein [Candidatus Heimdallarchaeota archaeon]MBY8994607.1 hypothetical protein [Candidatus Heimdallarchaeota archaeon]